MTRRDTDLVDWWNALPEAVRGRIFTALGLDRPATSVATDDETRLETAISLSDDTPTKRVN